MLFLNCKAYYNRITGRDIMKNTFTQNEYKLTYQNIDIAVTQVIEFLEERNTDRKNIIRIRLGIEEALLRYRDAYGEDKEFVLKLSDGLGRKRVSISVEGYMLDPFAKNNATEQGSVFMRAALANIGEMPMWKYSRGINTLSYTIEHKHLSSWAQLIIALVMAFIVGFALKMLPAGVTESIQNNLVTPLVNTFMNLLSAIAGPMIFLAVVWGIYSVGDVSTFSALGKKLLVRFFVYITGLTILIGLAITPAFSLVRGQAQVGSGFAEIFQMLLNIIPGNIIKPFEEGNTLQILFIGIVMGISMIIIGEKTQTIAIFAEQLNYIVQFVMGIISRLVPLFVFLSLLDIILNNQVEEIKVSYKLFAVNAIGCIALIITYIIIVSIRMKAKPLLFFKKALKTMLIGITTASSAAAFATNLETCKKDYGIEESFTNFGIPFAQVIYKPAVGILYFTSALYAAEAYGVAVSTSWFVALFIMSVILSVATPPIPGGALASISVLFAQLGLPVEGLTVVLALNIILDFIETPADIFGGQSMVILTAKQTKLIDEEVFRN